MAVDVMPAMSLALTEEQEMIRQAARKFAREKIAPVAAHFDETGEFPSETIKEMGHMGLMGIEVPEEYEGQAGSFFQCVLAVEELSAVDPSAGVVVDVQNTLVNNALLRWGTDAQKRRYLPALASGAVGAYALSEAGSGSDAFALAARAVASGGDFLLTGRKLWISNAYEAGLFLLFANANPEAGHRGITAFLVERDAPGFQV